MDTVATLKAVLELKNEADNLFNRRIQLLLDRDTNERQIDCEESRVINTRLKEIWFKVQAILINA